MIASPALSAPPAKHAAPGRRDRRRVVVAAGFAAGVLAFTGAGVYAALTATASNTTAQPVSSGTLSLALSSATGAAALSDAVGPLAPGDVVRRHVTLTNNGTLDGQSLGLAVRPAAANALSDALTVAVRACPVAWAADGSCGGTPVDVLAATALPELATAKAFTGPVDLAAGSVAHLQLVLSLSNVTEEVVNGVLPPGSVQGLTAGLTYAFSVAQRTAADTAS